MMNKWYNKIKTVTNCLNNDEDLQLSISEIQTLDIMYPEYHPFELINKYKGKGEYKDIRAKQISSEIIALYDIVASKTPHIICEIGTYKGGTLYLWTRAAADNSLIISIDLPPGLKNAYTANRQNFYQHFARNHQCVSCLAGDSHSNKTKDKLKLLLGNRTIDFLFIDGDHSYEGVRSDFEMYSPLVSDGGLIAFHDILPRPDFENIQVYKLWNELVNIYEYYEYIDKNEKKIGIGVIVWRS